MTSYEIASKSTVEGFGIVYLEANYLKLPVIGSYSGGVPEAIKENVTGFLIEPNNINQLVENILYFIQNPNERKIMSILNWFLKVDLNTYLKIATTLAGLLST